MEEKRGFSLQLTVTPYVSQHFKPTFQVFILNILHFHHFQQ